MSTPSNTMKFCGKIVSDEDLALIQEMAQDFAHLSRTEFAATICELLGWTRANGKVKESECLYFLEALESEGLFTLPERRRGKTH